MTGSDNNNKTGVPSRTRIILWDHYTGDYMQSEPEEITNAKFYRLSKEGRVVGYDEDKKAYRVIIIGVSREI